MTAVLPTAANISATETRGAIFERYIAGEAITLGQAVYVDANWKAWKAKADSSAHASAIGIAAIADNFYGETTIPIGGTVAVVVFGPVYGFSSLINGQSLWVDKTTAGSLNDAAPTTAYQFVLGHAVDNETFFVDPGSASPVSA